MTETLAEIGDAPHLTRSSLEDAFLQLMKDANLPTPTPNAGIDGMEVDACWPEQRLVVELDGWDAHHTRQAFQRDRERSNDLTLSGYTVLRFTYADVTRDRDRTIGRLVRALRYPPPP